VAALEEPRPAENHSAAPASNPAAPARGSTGTPRIRPNRPKRNGYDDHDGHALDPDKDLAFGRR
jgi:hypothetical protein